MIELVSHIIIWAIWRRVFGGWLGVSRYLTVISGFMLAATSFIHMGVLVAAGVGALSILFWTPGHDFRKNSALWNRYLHIGIPWMIMERFEGKRPLGMGWTEVAELGAGGLFGLTLYSVKSLVNFLVG